jgi:hypothetical protein
LYSCGKVSRRSIRLTGSLRRSYGRPGGFPGRSRFFEAPAMEYASVVWSHARGERELRWLNGAQKIGAQAITGSFRTVSLAVAEAEASIQTVGERHAQAGTKLYINGQTLPKTHPLATLRVSVSRRHISPTKRLALAHEESGMKRMETIQAYAVPPWHNRVAGVRG